MLPACAVSSLCSVSTNLPPLQPSVGGPLSDPPTCPHLALLRQLFPLFSPDNDDDNNNTNNLIILSLRFLLNF